LSTIFPTDSGAQTDHITFAKEHAMLLEIMRATRIYKHSIAMLDLQHYTWQMIDNYWWFCGPQHSAAVI
jgi:hypothetical protein